MTETTKDLRVTRFMATSFMSTLHFVKRRHFNTDTERLM